jgi:hypothetical protein
MKRQKKQYRPIAGQRWYEKILDWITREENFRWCIVGIVSYVVLLAVGGDISANVMNRPDIADVFMNLWFHFLPVVAVLVMINPLSDIWEIKAEKKLQKPIREYIEEHRFCTYNELVDVCMPLKIHLGIDSAIEKMLQQHELVLDADDRYRLPTDEDRRRWREEWLEEYGVKITFEDLERIFALDLEELEESIDIEFSLGEHDGYWIGKTEADDSDAEVFWCSMDAGPRRDFATFQKLAAAKLFDGQSLEAVWDDVTLTFINDHDMDFWLKEHLPTYD